VRSDHVLEVAGEGFSTEVPPRTLTDETSSPVSLPLASTVWDSLRINGDLWLATHDGLLRVSQHGVENLGAKFPLLGAPCRVLVSRPDGLWVGTLNGLILLKDEEAVEIKGDDGQSLGYIYALHVDVAQRLWVATLGRGLWRQEGNGLLAVLDPLLSVTGNTTSVSSSPSGQRMLVMQDDRITVWDADAGPRQIASQHPNAGWASLWLDDRTVAIGSSDGLYLIDVDTQHIGARINALYGASAWEFTNSRALVRGHDRRLYCGVNAGLFAVDLDALLKFQQPPLVALSGVHWSDSDVEQTGNVFRLKVGKWSMNARVYAAWLVDESLVSFRYRLVGFDYQWSELQASGEVRYNSLPSGRYHLQCQAQTSLTGFGPVVSLLTIHVEAASRIAAVSGWMQSLVGHTVRNRVLLDRHAEREAEIADRTEALAAANAELERRRAELEITAHTDAMTGWHNRRSFDQRAAIELHRSQRSQEPVGVLMIDVDYFKPYNDRYGHQAGDECLRVVTRTMLKHVRPFDIAARYGGEEFAMMMIGMDTGSLQIVGARLCAAIAELQLPHADAPAGVVTISIGGLSSIGGDMAALLRAADAALYVAKSNGRNQFVSAT
jgi:diguanylate cyclase (GGDEF)-like protein